MRHLNHRFCHARAGPSMGPVRRCVPPAPRTSLRVQSDVATLSMMHEGSREIVSQAAANEQVALSDAAPELGSWLETPPPSNQGMEYEVDSRGLRRVKFAPNGWKYWNWEGKRIHYTEAGPEDGPKVVLVHGYGASAYHWRYNIPALVDAGYKVYAPDLLGFGFIVGSGPVVLAGNSLGGYVSLATAASYPEQISAVALLNGAGPFDNPDRKIPDPDNWKDQLGVKVNLAVKRFTCWFGFIQAKQPGRIKQVLELVYFNKDVIDDDLVDSIILPTNDPQASEVFFRINNFKGPPVTVNTLLSKLKVPLLLLWGDKDPWIVPSTGYNIQKLYPSADLRFVSAGHCPHDDNSEDSNRELLEWMSTVDSSMSSTD
eukprot:gene14777-20827_t